MPIFEYVCASCSREFETLVRRGEQPVCPECGASDVSKLFSAPAAPVMSSSSLPLTGSCPPPNAGPCGPGCCRLPG
ncbi:zinc ribbon domain-containing protein [bacterium]|nr:zinc ribbon domain-containing protein [bacterium]